MCRLLVFLEKWKWNRLWQSQWTTSNQKTGQETDNAAGSDLDHLNLCPVCNPIQKQGVLGGNICIAIRGEKKDKLSAELSEGEMQSPSLTGLLNGEDGELGVCSTLLGLSQLPWIDAENTVHLLGERSEVRGEKHQVWSDRDI